MPHRLALLAAFVAAISLLGCGPKSGAGEPGDVHHEGGIPDMEDRCHIVSCGDEFHIDEDGCPDVFLGFDDGSAELDESTRRLLGEVKRDAEEIGSRLRTLTVVATYVSPEADDLAQRRAETIRAYLVSTGIDAAVLMTSDRPGSVSVGPGAWLEASCD